MVVYRCEDTAESIFTAVYRAYEEKRCHEDTMLCLTDDTFLFAEDMEVEADAVKTRKVMNTLLRRFGREDCRRLSMALAAEDEEKAQAVYRTIVEGLRCKVGPGHLFDNLASALRNDDAELVTADRLFLRAEFSDECVYRRFVNHIYTSPCWVCFIIC